MNPKNVLNVLFLIVLIAGTSHAFDGQRKGFVLGGGLGIAPTAGWAANSESSEYILQIVRNTSRTEESGTGTAANIFLGYAWDEHNMIVWEGSAAVFDSDFWNGEIEQGFSGPTWYHYFGRPGRSLVALVGFGLYFTRFAEVDGNEAGLGVLVGTGFEFTRHLQVTGYYSAGRTTGLTDLGIGFSHDHISVLLNVVAF